MFSTEVSSLTIILVDKASAAKFALNDLLELNTSHEGERLDALFIHLFIYWSNRMAALLLCYHSTALYTSKGDISASTICYLWRLFLVHFYTVRPS